MRQPLSQQNWNVSGGSGQDVTYPCSRPPPRIPSTGGHTTAYAYPQDPINGYDLDGLFGFSDLKRKVSSGLHWVSTHKRTVAGVGASFACGASIVCGVAVSASFGVAKYVSKSYEDHMRVTLSGVAEAAVKGAITGGMAKQAKVSIGRVGKKHVGSLKPKPRPQGGSHAGERDWRPWKW